ncbi:hypothetical protein H5410_047689 [Solanum commersonii]|uniref:Auxin-responsive protein n=1 Tax=Solanum commersonii TaxID=4109 RepID=A0A9J5XI24_SOLCO|nr:hypothetical protein H5410_047689 [Solanum commersonii]
MGIYEKDLNDLEATELRLGLPGIIDESSTSTSTAKNSKKRPSSSVNENEQQDSPPPPKAQVVGWPPVRSYRKNHVSKLSESDNNSSGMYLKVSMDGAPYLRKIDLKVYKSYQELLKALQNMFKCTIGKFCYTVDECTQKEKDIMDLIMHQHMKTRMVIGCLLVMYHGRCLSVLAKGLEVIKGSEAKGLACP